MGGLMDYKARFYSSSLGRFVQPDSIIPGPANPQAWNRFSYVANNPVRFNDPSGHMRMEEMGDKRGCTDPKYCKTGEIIAKKGGFENTKRNASTFEENKGCNDLGINTTNCYLWQKRLTNLTLALDNIGALVSFGEAAVADIFYIGALSATTLSGGALTEAFVVAAYADWQIALWGGNIENSAGFLSALSTTANDYLSGYNVRSNGNLYLGKDTIVSTRNFILGLIPESNLDAIVSASQLKYDMDRLNGIKSNEQILINTSNVDQIVGQVFAYDSPLEDILNFFGYSR
jgi:RHS repeat-associated protein